jgi:hypothetical protein
LRSTTPEGTELMGITGFFRTIFGHSDEEKDLRRRAGEEMRRRRSGTESIKDAQAQLKDAQARLHARAEEIRKRAEVDQPESGTDDGEGKGEVRTRVSDA